MDLDAVADELYSLPPQEFTSSRGTREKEARAAGDRQLAAAIHLLPKPTTAAWLVNQLVRKHREEIGRFLDLGVVLREATATLRGEQLRELDQQKRRLVQALMAQVRAVATAAGHQVTESTAQGVEDTLHAVLADEAAAGQLRAGRLTAALHRTGFPPATSSPSAEPAPARPAAGDPTGTETDAPATAAQARAAQRSRAELDEQLARTALRDTTRTRDKARSVADRAGTAAQAAAARVGRLRADLDQAELEARSKEQEHLQAQADAERAETNAREAARRLEDAVQARLAIDVADVSHPGAPTRP